MGAAVLEADARAGHQVADRPRHEDLAGLGQGGNPSCNVDVDPTDLPGDDLALPDMQSRSDLDAEFGRGVTDGSGAPDGSGGSVERGEHTVARGVDLTAVEPLQLTADHGQERLQQVGATRDRPC